jgi:hypothetical protein
LKSAPLVQNGADFFVLVHSLELSLQRLEKMIFKKKKSTHLNYFYVKQTLVKRHLQQ